jgi:hypothetical protein
MDSGGFMLAGLVVFGGLCVALFALVVRAFEAADKKKRNAKPKGGE